MSGLIGAALAPAVVAAFYIYIRDKYEKEPVRLLVTGLLFGVLSAIPIVQVELLITSYMPVMGHVGEAFYLSFAVASFTEEIFKFLILFFLVWRNENFNERFDGIVYAVFISLGFAGIENMLYVLNPMMGGWPTAVSRAIFSVPGHALFGVAMGYFFALSKYEPERRAVHGIKAFLAPFLLHGFYDFILLSGHPWLMAVFVPFVVYLWVGGLKKMRRHIAMSPFKAE